MTQFVDTCLRCGERGQLQVTVDARVAYDLVTVNAGNQQWVFSDVLEEVPNTREVECRACGAYWPHPVFNEYDHLIDLGEEGS